MWNRHQTINHWFSSVSLDLLAETAAPYQGCDNWQECASPWAQSESQHLLSLTKRDVDIPKMSKGKRFSNVHNHIRFWLSAWECVASHPRLCAVFPLWHVGDCYGTCHGLGQDYFFEMMIMARTISAKLFDQSHGDEGRHASRILKPFSNSKKPCYKWHQMTMVCLHK